MKLAETAGAHPPAGVLVVGALGICAVLAFCFWMMSRPGRVARKQRHAVAAPVPRWTPGRQRSGEVVQINREHRARRPGHGG